MPFTPRAQVILTTALKDHANKQFQTAYVKFLLSRDFPLLTRSLAPPLQDEISLCLAGRIKQHRLRKSWSKEVYVFAAVMLGTDFDTDPAYPQAAAILAQNAPCYLRMHDLRDMMLWHRDHAFGERWQGYQAALQQIAAHEPDVLRAALLRPDARDIILNLAPARAALLTADQLETLTQICNAASQRHFPPDDQYAGAALLFTHAFFLGAGSLNDPQHDYIRTILRSQSPTKLDDLLTYALHRAKAMLRAFNRFHAGKAVTDV